MRRPGRASWSTAIDIRTKLIYAAIVLVTTLVTLRRPAVAAGLLLCTYGLEQWAQSQTPYFFVHGSLTNYVTALVAALGIAVHLIRGRPVFKTVTAEYWLSIALFVWMAASLTWSVYPSATWEQWNAALPYFIPFTLWLPLLVLDGEDLRDAFLSTLTIGTILAALLLATSEWNGRRIIFQSGAMITLDDLQFGNPLAIGDLGAYVALIAALANFQDRSRLWPVLRWVVVGLGVALTLKTGSRGQTIAIVAGVICFLPYSRRFRDLQSVATSTVAIALFAVIAVVLFDAATKTSSGTTDVRWSLGEALTDYQGSRLGKALILLRAYFASDPIHWALGLGSSASFDPTIVGFYPHMAAAEALGELGVVGVVLFGLILYLPTRRLVELWPLVRDDPRRRGLIAAFGSFVMLEYILMFKEGSLLGSTTAYGLFAILGRVTAEIRREQARQAELDAGGYAMTDEDLAAEAHDWDADFGDARHPDDAYLPEPVGGHHG